MAATDPVRNETDALASLEERILRAVQLVNQLRQEKDAAEKLAQSYASDNDSASTNISELKAENQRLVDEMDTLRSERKQVRTRIEKLLGQLDTLAS